MSLRKLKIRHWREQLHLKSKQDIMSKSYSNSKIGVKIFEWGFKIFTLTFFALIIILPFYFMIEQSLVDRNFYNRGSTAIQWWPFNIDTLKVDKNGVRHYYGTYLAFQNYADAFRQGYFQALVFTAGITSFSILVRLFFSMTLGYALSMRNWKGKNFFFIFFLSLMIIPEIALLSGQYTIVVKLGWTDKSKWLWLSMILPFVASVFFSYMYKNAFEAIPNSVKESAMLDGASGLKYFFKIAMPMVKSTTWTVAILTGFASWNSYTWPSLISFDPSETNGYWSVMNLWLFKTGIVEQDGQRIMILSVRMAATIIAIAPMIIVYFVLRKRIISAISRQGNATKG